MELHAWKLVAAVLKRHRAALGLVHGYLDLSVEDAYRRLEGLRSDELGPHGLTVGGVVRDGMRERTACEVFQQCSLSVVRKSGNGVWLTDGRYVSIRIRRRPRDVRTGLPLRANSDQDSLPELGLSMLGQITLVIFWSSSLQSKVLERAVLAAVTHVEDRNRLTIVAESELPLATAASLGLIPGSAGNAAAVDEDDDLDDFWPMVEEGGGDDDPA